MLEVPGAAESALSDVCSGWRALVPPNRIRVSEGAAQNLRIARPGGASGFWNPAETPYMVEPVDVLGSRTHAAVCFVGPSQSGKTVSMGEGWLGHAVVNDPGDMLVVQMTQDKAREYSKQRIDRAIRNSPTLHAMRGLSSRDDNLHDKQFRNGMIVRIGWPTASNLSSTSYRYVFLTDYDRVDDDIEGEGDMFTLGLARTRTFLSRGKLGVESSPGRPILDPSWRASTPHEAPPVGGVLGIYNRGDRRRHYWQCPECREWMIASPGLGLFNLPSDDELIESIRTLDIPTFARQHARVVCPASGCLVPWRYRESMNQSGRWLRDGVAIDSRGRVSGTPRTSSIASFWLGGVAAAYTTWEQLIAKHCMGLLEFALNGSELPLQTTCNTDQGMPYLSRHLAAAADARGRPEERAEDELERYVVPDEGRFLVAAVDVQGGRNARFIVQVMAVWPDLEQSLVDRYELKHSEREGMGENTAPIDPASYAEDWEVLTKHVLAATYRTNDPNREMKVKLVVVDTGGEEGVTDKAYAWYRSLRRRGLAHQVMLTKGHNTKVDWVIRETAVGGKPSDVPLFLLNPNLLKDAVYTNLARKTPGPGYFHFPTPKGPSNPSGWLQQAFFDEFDAEVRQPNGTYKQVRPRNESLDLTCMVRAGCLKLRADRPRFWLSPPTWAREHEANSEIVTPETRRELKEAARKPPEPRERRVRRSAYLGA